jgi:hypothetical protein
MMSKRIIFVNLTVLENNKPKHHKKVVITEDVEVYKGNKITKIEIIKHVGYCNSNKSSS